MINLSYLDDHIIYFSKDRYTKDGLTECELINNEPISHEQELQTSNTTSHRSQWRTVQRNQRTASVQLTNLKLENNQSAEVHL